MTLLGIVPIATNVRAAFPRVAVDQRAADVRDVRQIREVRRINTDTDGRRRNTQRRRNRRRTRGTRRGGRGCLRHRTVRLGNRGEDQHGCRAGDGLTVGQRVTKGSVEGNDAVDADYLYRPTGAWGISDDAESGCWCDLVVRGDQ